MKIEDYQEKILLVYITLEAISNMPLKEMHDAQVNADTMGPFLDPTAYREKGQAMREDMEATKILLKAKNDFQQFKDRRKNENS